MSCGQGLIMSSGAQDKFFLSLDSRLNDRSLISLVLSDRGKLPHGSEVENELSLKTVKAKLVELKKTGVQLQCTYRYTTNDQTKIYSPHEVTSLMKELIATYRFKTVELKTIDAGHKLSLRRGGGKYSINTLTDESKRIVDLAHDRRKNVPVDPAAPFLRALKITNDGGRTKAGMRDKLRQIQKVCFAKLFSRII
jgi:hypothetical protein